MPSVRGILDGGYGSLTGFGMTLFYGTGARITTV